MRKRMIPAVLLCLSVMACSKIGSPEEEYIRTLNLASVTIDGAAAYAEDCARHKPKGDPCEAVVLKLEKPMLHLKGAKDQASRVIVTKDSPYYDLSKTVLENAIANVSNILVGADQ